MLNPAIQSKDVDEVAQNLIEVGITATELQNAVKHLTKKNLNTY